MADQQQQPPGGFRGTPPNAKELKERLGAVRLGLWQQAIELGTEFGAIWRWAHSKATDAWSYRAYLPGERFFTALSLTENGFEASTNLKADEWEIVPAEGAAQADRVDALRAAALATGKDPAWIHLAIAEPDDLKLLTKLLFARGRRQEAPRRGKRPKR